MSVTLGKFPQCDSASSQAGPLFHHLQDNSLLVFEVFSFAVLFSIVNGITVETRII